MPTITLDNIILVGLMMAFILPAMVVVSTTLPPPIQANGASINVTQLMNSTGIYINSHFQSTFNSLNSTLLGKNGNGGSFSAASPTISTFAFIISGLGSIMTDLVQLPYLDLLSMNLIIVGLSTVIPGAYLGFVNVGIQLLYVYMGISLLLVGISAIQKYNLQGD